MTVKINKWGNSYGIRLSKQILKSLDLQENSEVDIEIREGKIILIPKKSLQSLLSQITPQNIHREIDFGDMQGKELL
ncbi:AbrB/MazE/SpoVT family DNA-binding domain-containing protein [Nitratiruptor sp. YY09-18]|uniref:AbrB/MazE/SpoVT family DNA-binding domain-containing protein n=1 Tax=Nitratiruptor sp. YY09-18 TaxID=2724901 RepID=UPI001916BB31|nr:AbrB/MazE/SpoVT family DNA-binding domain-containing protein [Nitratiruptor sp. YY09-18]BCD67961.1 antitoxin MazE [Nitratiruptor sp. YY09-18]